MTVGEYLLEWLDGQMLVVRSSTAEALTIYITRHLIPFFPKDLRLDDLTPPMCQSYAKSKLKDGRANGKGGLSPVSVKKHISVLRQALAEAVRLGLIPTNPAQCVKLPRQRGRPCRTVFLTAEEGKRVIAAFRGSALYPVVVITLYYGLRRSEVLGLRWSAVDFERNTLTVCHTVVKNLTVTAQDSTKSESSYRTYGLLAEVREMLSDPRICPVKGDYIFHRSDGSPLRPDSLTRSFQRVLRRAGLPAMRFHDLRHSTASILFDLGWSLEDVKNWLGHADIETTSNIYLHYQSTRKVLLGESLVGLFVNAKGLS